MNAISLLLLATLQTPAAEIELVESAPIETTLDHPDIRDASVVWLEMVERAQRSLDFAEFYASDAPGSKLAPIVDAIEKAAKRGVRVRFLLSEAFHATYPEIAERMSKVAGVLVRWYDMKKLPGGGGVLHAKYFVVDGNEAFFGSQNFDWRSLEHIQELGVRVTGSPIPRELQSTFDKDWRAAGGETMSAEAWRATPIAAEPVSARCRDGEVTILAAESPKELVPEAMWDLPKIVALVDGATESVRVQLLTYKATTRDRTFWPELEDALRRAAARRVRVQLLVADWCKRKGTIEGLQSLEPLENVEVKLVAIPPWSGGFVPYGRVCHAKYLVVDGARSWIGTSNWERDYFYESRNVGLVVEGAAFATQLEHVFADGWGSKYATAVDPSAAYEPPRIDK